jgi:hypothetical protein
MNKWVGLIAATTLFVATGAEAQRGRYEARPCRGDLFYVDVPLILENVPWTSAAFMKEVGDKLEYLANQPGAPWFCGFDQITCPSEPILVRAESLLPKRVERFRDDGDLRFFRIRFESARRLLTVRPSSACEVVAEIRHQVVQITGVNAEDFYVGRECDSSAMSAQSQPSPEMSGWHWRRMGLDPVTVPLQAPPLAVQTVDLALLDSGVDPTVAQDIGLASERDYGLFGAGLHSHGSAMAILARQLAPQTALLSSRVIETGGTGTSASLARAIDDLLYVRSSADRPLVINLSLGWPSELGRASRISESIKACLSYEDPFGEPIRYLLDVAQRLDESGLRKIMVVAAAGNQPLSAPTNVFPPPPSNWAPALCATEPQPGQPWFFPAMWDRTSSCRGSASNGLTRVAFGVSVVDDRDLPAGVAIPDAEAPLVTPGQHVSVADPVVASPPPSSTCGASVYPAPLSLPASITGSSVGAVLTSAAAARAQGARIAAQRPTLSSKALARVLYLSGNALCRATPAGVPVRRLDVARLDQAVATCEPLLVCAAQFPSLTSIAPDLLVACKNELASCGLERLDTAGNLIPNCPTQDPPIAWDPTYASPTCVASTGSFSFANAANCSGTCPFESVGYHALFGSLGPEPGDPACPDCELVLNMSLPSAPTFTFYAELSDKFPAGTTFSQPYLVFNGPDAATQAPKTYYSNLLNVSSAASWKPGAYLKLDGPLTGAPNLNWSKTKATLSVLVTAPGGASSKDVSALRLVLP